MENVGEKSGKKISLVGVWLEGGEKKILVGPGNFLPNFTKMFSPQNGGENWEKNSHYIEQTKIPMRKQGRTQDFKLGGAGDKRIFFFQIRIHIVLINYRQDKYPKIIVS